MTHQQIVVYVIVGTIAFALWTWFWLWLAWMAVRVLRWTYLEKKYAWDEANRQSWTPPAPVLARMDG
jgi:hypothetical protein